jgi:short-subunit dehydrogenase
MSFRTILITGATSGIGEALVREYSQKTNFLILVGRCELKLKALCDNCQRSGTNAVYYVANFESPSDVLTLSEEIATTHQVDLLISNAGVTSSTEKGQIEDWDKIEALTAVNYRSAIAIAQPFIHQMQRRGSGHIAYVSSLAAYRGMPLTPSYAASKAALKSYAEAMRGLLKPQSIHVSIVTPGFVKTAMSDQFPGDRPFLWSAERAASYIKHGLDRKKSYISFPKLLTIGMKLLACLPAWLSDSILARLRY